MRNIFFKEEFITENDLYFVCSMVERVARTIRQPDKNVVKRLGYHALAEKLALAYVLHSENPLAVVDDWIDTYHLQEGDFDVTNVDPYYCETIPTELQMGKVYMRLILMTMDSTEDYAQAILRVYNNPICKIIDNYNSSAYYEPSPFIARSYFVGSFN